MKSGYVYVITTNLYRERDIYKIGFTDNLERRLKQFNNTRTHDDQFYIVNYWKTVRYMTLETKIHHALAEHHLKNELFQCSLDEINNTVKQIFHNNSFFNHHDLIIEGVSKNRIRWYRKRGYFSIESGGVEVMMNDKVIVEEVKKWLSVNDKYKLYQFICPSYFDDLVLFLKEHCAVNEADELATGVAYMKVGDNVEVNVDEMDEVNVGMRTLVIGD